MEVLVYGFSRRPGELPEIMNVGAGSLRLKFRGLSALPAFLGFDAVILPFDTYQPWMEGEVDPRRQAELHLRARVELLRAAGSGATVGFVYEDCFTHYTELADLEVHSLGTMVLADLGLSPAPLPGPEDRFQVLAPAFDRYLERFGIAESFLEIRRPCPGLHTLCRTGARQITGVAAPEGDGRILFLPGDPRNRFLEFFTALGGALQRFRDGEEAEVNGDEYVSAGELELRRSRNGMLRSLATIESRLDAYRRRRRWLALLSVNPQRRVPEWFAAFLGLEVRPAGESGIFLIPGSAGEGAAPLAILGVATSSACDTLLSLQATRNDLPRRDGETAGPPAILLLATGPGARRAGAPVSGGCRLAEKARKAGVLLLSPERLLRFLDEEGCSGRTGLQELIRRLSAASTDPS
jgi:hypothetical protein